MKHLRKVSVVREWVVYSPARCRGEASLNVADAKSDFLNALYAAWSDYMYAKKNELGA